MYRLASSIVSLLLASSLVAAQHAGVVQAGSTVVPGATVTATLGERKAVTTTDETGRYSFDDLTPGIWMLQVEIFGFEAETDYVPIATETSSTFLVVEVKQRPAPQVASQPNCVPLSVFLLTPTPAPVSTSKKSSAPPPVTAPPGPPPCVPLQFGLRTSGNKEQILSARLKIKAELAEAFARQQEVIAAKSKPQPPAPSPEPVATAVEPPPAAVEPPPAGGTPGQPPHPPAPEGFKVLTLAAKQPVSGEEAPAAAEDQAPPAADDADGNDALLVSGSVSTGLEAADQPDPSTMTAKQRKEYNKKRAQDPGAAGTPTSSSAMAPGFNEGAPGAMDTSAFKYGRHSSGSGGSSGSRGSSKGFHRTSSKVKKSNSTFGNRVAQADPITGSAYFTLHNSALDARHYSLTGQEQPRYSYATDRFGVSLGGPLSIPKLIASDATFFYFSYAGSRGRNPYNVVSTLGSPLERAGDFSQSFTRGPVTIFDPTTQQPFANNQIPKNRLNSAAMGLLSFIPAANLPGNVQNYQMQTSVPAASDSLSVRVNQSLSRRDRFDFSLNWLKSDRQTSQIFGFRDTQDTNGFNSTIGWKHYWGPKTVTELRWNMSRNRNNALPYFAYSSNVAAQLGINGTSQDPINWGPPNLSFTNFGNLSDGSPSVRRDQTSALTSYLYVSRHRHNMYFGGEYRRIQQNNLAYQNARGSFSFSGLATSGLDSSGLPIASTGFDFADFLLGLPQTSSLRFGGDNTYFRSSLLAAYAKDDWRARPNLTFDLGIRYEFFSPLTEKFNRMANLDVAPGFTGVAVVTPGQAGPWSGRFPNGLVDPDRNNFSPRIGMAYRPFRKRHVLIRSGYGIYFNGGQYQQFGTRMASQPPFAPKTASLSTSLANPLTIQNGFPALPSDTIKNTFAVDRNYKIGYAQTWNFLVQQSLPHAMVVEVGYLATKGTGLDIQRLPNRAAPGSPLTAEQRRIIGNATGFTFETSEGNSIYHAAQVRLTRRFTKGLSLNALYTHGRSIDNVSTFGGGGTVVAQFDTNLALERGVSSFNQPNSLTVEYLLMSPFTDHGSLFRRGGASPRALRNWMFSGSMTAVSGTPFTARVSGNRADSGGTGVVGSGRADATGLAVDGAPFFNLLAFGIPPAGRYGNAGRNTISGPFRAIANLGVTRSFRFKDGKYRMEFRADATNVTNHPSITSFGTTVNAKTYGLPSAAQGMRTVTGTLRFRF